MLKTLFEPEDTRVFAGKLQNLHQKGWIEKNEENNKIHFKCNPVVQEVVRKKNIRLLEDCAGLISRMWTSKTVWRFLTPNWGGFMKKFFPEKILRLVSGLA